LLETELYNILVTVKNRFRKTSETLEQVGLENRNW